MNAKKAKKLRQIVRQATATPSLADVSQETVYYENEKNRRYNTVSRLSGDGKSFYQDKDLIAAGTIKVAPNCTKGLYKALKKVQ